MTVYRPPIWFWIVVALLILWGLSGVGMFHWSQTEGFRAQLDGYDRAHYANAPRWYLAVYGLAVWSGLIGSVLLALRKRVARPFYIVSLVAVVVMFGFEFVGTDLIATKGVLVATGFPIFIALVCVFEIWLAGLATRRGWIA